MKSGCGAYKNNTWQKYPVKQIKPQRKRIDKTVFILSVGDKIAVRHRDEQGLLAGLWEFPNIDRKMTEEEAGKWLQQKGIEVIQMEKHKTTKHIFTHLEWYMNCYHVMCKETNDTFEWVSKEELNNTVPLPTAFRKCL